MVFSNRTKAAKSLWVWWTGRAPLQSLKCQTVIGRTAENVFFWVILSDNLLPMWQRPNKQLLTQIQQPQIFLRFHCCNSALPAQISGATSPLTSCSNSPNSRGLRMCPRAAHPMQGLGTHCSTSKSTEQWCVGTKTHPKHPKLQSDSFSCSYLNPLGKLCVQDPQSLYHINVYIACPKERAIMLNHKSETTYNSTRHRGKSRPPYHAIKRETNWFVSRIGEQVIFLTAQSSPRAPQMLAAQKKINQPKQNRPLHLCLILPVKLHTLCPTKIMTLDFPHIFSSDFHIFKSSFILWNIYRPMSFLIKGKKKRGKVSSNISSLLLIHFWKHLKVSPDQHF